MAVSTVLLATLPVFVLIVLGLVLARTGFVATGFWAPAEKLTYYALFPPLIVVTLAEANLTLADVADAAIALTVAILAMTVGLMATRTLVREPVGVFASTVQGAVRMNTYIGLAIAAGLFGDAGVTAAAIAIAVIVPVVNVISVLAHGTDVKPLALARQLATNPLILACVIGLALNGSGMGLPPVIGPTLEILGRGALTIGLLAVGAALDFGEVRQFAGRIAVTTLLKLAVLPLITAFLCLAVGLDGITASVVVMYNGLPTATSAYILARQLGGHAPLMAGLTTVQTAVAAVTLPMLMIGLAHLFPVANASP